MSNYRNLTQENFDALLSWLSPDREKAGIKYEQIRKKLLRFIEFKGCHNPEDLIDEIINRVVGKLPTLNLSEGHQPITIFYGFANKVYFEYLKQEQRELPLEEAGSLKTESVDTDARMSALEECLQNLNESEKFLVIQYYSADKSKKFEIRRDLAEKFNLTMGAMHIKVHRLRKALHNCIAKRLKKNM